MSKRYGSMRKIKKSNPGFFGEEVMEAVDSRIETGCLAFDMFVTSERPKDSNERRYTVRRAIEYTTEPHAGNPVETITHDIVNISAYGEYATKTEALNAARDYRKFLELKGKDLLQELMSEIKHETNPGGITAVVQPARGIQLVASTRPSEEEDADMYVVEIVYQNATEMIRTLTTGENPVSEAWVRDLLLATGAYVYDEQKTLPAL